jgi:hypothetical protein
MEGAMALRSFHFRLTTALLATVCGAIAADAAPTAEMKCQRDRLRAAAAYQSCHQRVFARLHGGTLGSEVRWRKAMTPCRERYQAAWPRLRAQAAGTGSTCDQPRFTDNGLTVTDNLTALVWEKKTDDDSLHDVDQVYTWSAVGTFTPADGTAFTSFLAPVNAGCFAGQCDWRLPTVAELQTILESPPCGTEPCIDPAFGPTALGAYYSAISRITPASQVWIVNFNFFNTGLTFTNKSAGALHVRAVRGGS